MSNAAKLLYMHICDDVRQEMGDKVSLMGLFDRISAAEFPVMHPRLAIVAAWSGGEGEFRSAIRLLAPDGQVMVDLGEAKIKLRDASHLHRHVAFLFNWKIERPGKYGVEVSLDGQRVALAPLHVERQVIQ